ncbi:MAG: hypothetical protein ABIH08_02740 [Candidatus Omnitrophota bacterium]
MRKKTFNDSGKARGFTLWELMVAAAISIIAIGSLLIAFMSCMALNDANNSLIVAANDAQSVLEDVKTISFSAIDSYAPLQPANLENEIVAFQVSSIDARLKEVTISVTWTEKQRNRNFQLSTRFAQ